MIAPREEGIKNVLHWLMGEEAAVTLGIQTERFRKILLVITSLVTGVLVAVSGAIGFVGLMIPHIVRLLLGSNRRCRKVMGRGKLGRGREARSGSDFDL